MIDALIGERLERHYRDMQDVEFTIQEGKLFMLQTRSGKRTAEAALKAAVDMEREGLIDRKVAVTRVEPEALNQLLHPTLDPSAPREIASFIPEPCGGRPSPQSNDVDIDDRGLIYLADRNIGLDILELRR